MSRKLRLMIPLCVVMVAVLVVGYFSITSLSVPGDNDVSEGNSTVAVSTESFESKNLNAPTTALETLAPQVVVVESDVDVNAPEEDYDSALEEAAEENGSGYILTEDERKAVECAVMCEAGGEGTMGQMMVAQSILDGSLRNGYNVYQTIYQYEVASTSYSKVTDEVRESVSRVFDDGERVTEEKTDLWYNPALVESEWHEQQQYVITVGSHRFFWMNYDM